MSEQKIHYFHIILNTMKKTNDSDLEFNKTFI